MIKINEWSVKHETDIALNFLKRNKERENAVFISFNPPHTPLDLIPEKYVNLYKGKKLTVKPNIKFNKISDHTKSYPEFDVTEDEYQNILRKYYGAVSGIDENFGRIIKYLKDNDLYNKTLIVLTADHGEMLCAHRLWSKHVWYEESIGVPFLLKNINTSKKMQTNTVLNGVDIMPTLLSLLNLTIPDSVEGKDLSKEINGENVDNLGFISAYPGQISAIEKFKSENLDPLSYGWRGVRDKDFLYVVNRGYSSYEKCRHYLYNLKNDPYQLNPMDLSHRENKNLGAKYEKKLKEWLDKYKDPFINLR